MRLWHNWRGKANFEHEKGAATALQHLSNSYPPAFRGERRSIRELCTRLVARRSAWLSRSAPPTSVITTGLACWGLCRNSKRQVDWWGRLRRGQSDDPSYGRFPELRHLSPEVAAFADVATTPVSPVIPSWHGLRVFAFTNCTNCAVAAQELIERLTILGHFRLQRTAYTAWRVLLSIIGGGICLILSRTCYI